MYISYQDYYYLRYSNSHIIYSYLDHHHHLSSESDEANYYSLFKRPTECFEGHNACFFFSLNPRGLRRVFESGERSLVLRCWKAIITTRRRSKCFRNTIIFMTTIISSPSVSAATAWGREGSSLISGVRQHWAVSDRGSSGGIGEVVQHLRPVRGVHSRSSRACRAMRITPWSSTPVLFRGKARLHRRKEMHKRKLYVCWFILPECIVVVTSHSLWYRVVGQASIPSLFATFTQLPTHPEITPTTTMMTHNNDVMGCFRLHTCYHLSIWVIFFLFGWLPGQQILQKQLDQQKSPWLEQFFSVANINFNYRK